VLAGPGAATPVPRSFWRWARGEWWREQVDATSAPFTERESGSSEDVNKVEA